MSKDNYQVIAERIRKIQPFKGNSSKGVIFDGSYSVYSYNTPIFYYTLSTGKSNYFDYEFYSIATSKIQAIIANTFFNQSLKEHRKYQLPKHF